MTAPRRADPVPYPVARDVDPACRGADPELFFPFADAHARQAKAICHRCPLLGRCLPYAIAYAVTGVWGATTEGERNAYRRANGIQPISILAHHSGLDRALARLPGRPRSPRRPRQPAAPDPAPPPVEQAEPAPPETDIKTCPRCHARRLISDYYSNPGNADGLAAWCKPCFGEMSTRSIHV